MKIKTLPAFGRRASFHLHGFQEIDFLIIKINFPAKRYLKFTIPLARDESSKHTELFLL